MKKLFKFLLILISLFIIGIFSSIILQIYILPKINTSSLSRIGIFKELSENVTIVNKTEQVTVSEESSVNKISSQASAAVVNIISMSDKGKSAANPSGGIKNGTGIIVTSDGLIATYRRAIIESEAKYKVLLLNGSSFDAKFLGIDEFSNLAYFKIDATNLSVISFANSDDFFAGKKLIAIGNSSEEYQNRYAAGLLSNLDKTFNIAGKTLSSSEKLEGVFETDIDSQEKYLGGPVIDYNGELVGIIGSLTIDNKEKFFQIPANDVKNSIELAIRNELNTRPTLGIYYLPLTKAYAIGNNLNQERGAMIYSPSGKQGLAIITGSPAEKAGLKINDIITQVNGQEVNLENPLSNLISQSKKSAEMELTILRDRQEMKIKVNL